MDPLYSVLKSREFPEKEPPEYLTGDMRNGRYVWTKNPEFRYTFPYELAAYFAITLGGYIKKE